MCPKKGTQIVNIPIVHGKASYNDYMFRTILCMWKTSSIKDIAINFKYNSTSL